MYLARTALIGDTFQIELEFRNVVTIAYNYCVTIAYNVHDIRAISSLDDETYSTFLELLKG